MLKQIQILLGRIIPTVILILLIPISLVVGIVNYARHVIIRKISHK